MFTTCASVVERVSLVTFIYQVSDPEPFVPACVEGEQQEKQTLLPKPLKRKKQQVDRKQCRFMV